jgi:hypothetical protein
MHYSSGMIVLSIVGALLAIVLLLYLPRRQAMARVADADRSQVSEAQFVGGGAWSCKWWPVGATWPLVRIEVFPWGVRIGPNYRWISWFLPVTEFRWEEVESARISSFWGLKVQIRRPSPSWIAFTSNRGLSLARTDSGLVSAFRQHGIDVE